MNVNPEARMTERVTIVHRTSEDVDAWTSTSLWGSWQETKRRDTDATGSVAWADVLIVQIPEDQGEVSVSMGDYLVRGDFSFEGTSSELVRALPSGSRRVGTIRDRRGGISGVRNVPMLRYASALILEAD